MVPSRVKLSLIFGRIMSRKSVEIAKRFQGGKKVEFGKKLLESTRQSEIINKESELQWKEGMMEFESIGLHRLKETSSAVQEKQITSYKRNASKIDDETVLLYNLP
ncbi:unnamed protein product [Rhizophagus irregularis]|nr:unnamed protein product [Rhizophagus irregularis]